MSAAEILEFFEGWMLRQFGANAATIQNCRIHSEADRMIEDDPEFWQAQPMWNLYNAAQDRLI